MNRCNNSLGFCRAKRSLNTMTTISSKQILQDNETREPDAITALALNHKALSDVSCLSEFKNLEKLDLRFNNLSSLEGLRSCVNLKWVSVVQNKLQSLKGIEGLIKLTVLNAGKNKLRSMNEVLNAGKNALRSMNEVRSLVNLRALILNDNEIVSICRLDNMKELNTLVLSRNPIREIGESLVKMKSITKLSLSNCQLQSIDSSLKSCVELKELRLAHNDIKTVPAELARNTKVQNLDLGNNFITRWSDLKVLSSLVNLKNLNLQGNPIAEKDKLAKKIKKLVPNLQIFNARLIDQNMKNEKGHRIDDSSLNIANKSGFQKEEKTDHSMKNMNSKSSDVQHDNALDLEKKELKHKKQKRKELFKEKDPDHKEKSAFTEKELKKKVKEVQQEEVDVIDNEETPVTDSDVKKSKRKKQKTDVFPKDKDSDPKQVGATNENKIKRKLKKVQQCEANVIDDGETPFTDLFATDTTENVQRSGANKTDDETIQNISKIDGLVTFPVQRKKIKSQGKGHSALQLLSPVAEVGLGGPSTWDAE